MLVDSATWTQRRVAVLGSGSTIFYWIHVRRWRRPDMALTTAVPEDPVDFGSDNKVEAIISGRMPLRAEQRPTAEEADARCCLVRCAAPASSRALVWASPSASTSSPASP